MSQTRVRGLDRAHLFWELDLAPYLRESHPDLLPYIAAGLVGDGSDCFGYDDEISDDHDADTRVKLFVPPGMGGLVESRVLDGAPRDGVIQVVENTTFYRTYTGIESSPTTWREWLAIPEHNLAAATNGAVFHDPAGRFTARREELLAFYPSEVRLKLLEGRLLTMGQAGQYNHPRSLAHGEPLAAGMAKAEFIKAALSAVFLLNFRYMPFYKWAPRAARQLVLLAPIVGLLEEVSQATDATQPIEQACALILSELRGQGLVNSSSTFLVDQAKGIRALIDDPELREENPWRR